MATERQITANRANAKRSTGPRSAEGRQKSSRNAYRHGLSSSLPSDPTAEEKISAITDLLSQGAAAHDEQRVAAAELAKSAHRIVAHP